jgi:LuxR family maltose regulon positive regulatory protein
VTVATTIPPHQSPREPGGVTPTTRFRPAFPLVEAKLAPPVSPPGTVKREQLIQLLRAQACPPVVAVIAPAGFGKTLLLADWAARFPGAAAWLILDDFDNDPSVLLAYLAAAIDRVVPVDQSVGRALAARETRILATAVPRLAAVLGTWPRPGLLVLDDVDRLIDRTALDALTALIDYAPGGLTVAMAGRSAPALPFARFRAARELLEVGGAELALDLHEAQALVAAVNPALGPGGVQDLVARTEGWPVGVYLGALAASRPGGPPLGRVTGDEGYIAEYLRSELLAHLRDEDVEFLARTSILDPVEPGVAEVVSGLPDAASRLQWFARTNQLVRVVGPPAVGFRYHTLLREFLQAELSQREPGVEAELHALAAAWYAEQGRMEQAVEHALAGDIRLAADLVLRAVLPVWYSGHGDRLARWLRLFDDEVFLSHPSLAVTAALIDALLGRAASATRLAEIADRASGAGRPAGAFAAFESGRSMVRAAMASHGLATVLVDARAGVEAEQPGRAWRFFALYMLAGAEAMGGNKDRADDLFAEAIEAAEAAGIVPYYGLAARATIAASRRDWAAAADLAGKAHAGLDRTRLHDVVTAVHVHGVAARVAAHHGDFGQARTELVHAQIVRPSASYALPWVSVAALLEVARAYLAIADIAGARSAVAEAEQILHRRPDIGVLATRILEMRSELDRAPVALAGASTLTPAELRLLPVLSTPLTFREIGERLYLSPHTIKTQAISIYGKLEASSRSEAVERAIELGLLEPFPTLAPRPTRASD